MGLQLDNASPRSFLRWVGGKRQLLPELHKRLPERFESYFEPFIGGGALMWSLDKRKLRNIVINDYNVELVNLYQVIKSEPEKLIKHTSRHRNTEKYYYQLRNYDRQKTYNRRTAVTKASRFLYLNKTCFNGMARVNSKNQNNTPYGWLKKPTILDEDNIKQCSNFLSNVEILSGDFENIKPFLTNKSFIYLDPPYVPVSETANFTGYTDQGFDIEMQLRLKSFCDYMDSIGAKFMLSNSAVPFIHDLYSSYKIEMVMAGRSINCKGDGRGKVQEVIIRNY